jgi:flavorubredoxin
MITNTQSGTTVDEIADRIYRISTPVHILGGFTFNQYLIVDEAPVLFHTGPRRMFPLTREAIDRVIPVERLRYLGVSHFEADESGALNEFLAVAPRAVPISSTVGAMVSLSDVADRAPRGLANGEKLSIGSRQLRWLDTPHLPHGWDCGYMFDESTSTLLSGDLFTQGGVDHAPLTESDILGPSEAFRAPLDYFAHSINTAEMFERLAGLNPKTLACMHGSAWHGDGASLLRALAESVEATRTIAS